MLDQCGRRDALPIFGFSLSWVRMPRLAEAASPLSPGRCCPEQTDRSSARGPSSTKPSRCVEVILAGSPQAKARVERSFGTAQDRLVKEMRLEGIASLEGTNRFLQSGGGHFYTGTIPEPAAHGGLRRQVVYWELNQLFRAPHASKSFGDGLRLHKAIDGSTIRAELRFEKGQPMKRTQPLAYLLTLVLTVIACGELTGTSGWQCDVTLGMDNRSASGSGTGSTYEEARDGALSAACPLLGLSGEALDRCNAGQNPGASSWSIDWKCEGE